jgi:hypothetical protein
MGFLLRERERFACRFSNVSVSLIESYPYPHAHACTSIVKGRLHAYQSQSVICLQYNGMLIAAGEQDKHCNIVCVCIFPNGSALRLFVCTSKRAKEQTSFLFPVLEN